MSDITTETTETGISFLGGLTLSEFWSKHKTYIIIGGIVLIALIAIGVWWWKRKKTPENIIVPSKEEHHHHHDHHPEEKSLSSKSEASQGKRPINEKNFEIGKEKMKGTLQIMDKATGDLKEIIQSIQETKGKTSEDNKKRQEELTKRLEFTLNFLKKMNEQAKKFGGFLLEDAHELKQHTPEFQDKVDSDVKSAQEKFEKAVLLVQDLTKEMSSSDTEPSASSD